MYRGGSLVLVDFLVEHGVGLEGVVNSRGWTPLRIADGVALDGSRSSASRDGGAPA